MNCCWVSSPPGDAAVGRKVAEGMGPVLDLAVVLGESIYRDVTTGNRVKRSIFKLLNKAKE